MSLKKFFLCNYITILKQIQNGKVCCQYDTRCAQQRVVVDLEHSTAVQHRHRHNHQQQRRIIGGSSNRIHRASPEGPSTTDDAVEQKKKAGDITSFVKTTTSEANTRSGGSRTTKTTNGHRMSRSARLVRSTSNNADKNYVKSLPRPPPQSTIIASTTNSSPSSATTTDGGSDTLSSPATISQNVPGESDGAQVFSMDFGIISTKIVSQQQPESSGPT